MNIKTIVVIAAILTVLGAGYAVAGPANGLWNNMMGSSMMTDHGSGNGMMGSSGMMNGCGNGNGMMDSEMMNGCRNASGMMGGSGSCPGYDTAGYGSNRTPITIEKAN